MKEVQKPAGKNLGLSVLADEQDVREFLLFKKVKILKDIDALKTKLKSIEFLLSESSPPSSGKEKIVRSHGQRKSSSSPVHATSADVKTIVKDILSKGESAWNELKDSAVKKLREGGKSAKGVGLMLGRVLRSAEFFNTKRGLWKLRK